SASLNASQLSSGTVPFARIPVGTSSSTVAVGNHTHAYSSLTGIPSSFTPSAHTHNASDINAGTLAFARIPTGTTSSTVAVGNDSRINNGQTAYGWGNHASAGYATTSALTSGLATKQNTLTAGAN